MHVRCNLRTIRERMPRKPGNEPVSLPLPESRPLAAAGGTR